MCTPSAQANILQEQYRYEAERKSRHDHYLFANQAAREDAFNQWRGLGIQRVQEITATSQMLEETRSRALMSASHASVAAAEAGISGHAIDQMYRDYQISSAIESDRAMQRLYNEDMNRWEAERSVWAQWRARQLEAMGGPIARPNYWGAATHGLSQDMQIISMFRGGG